MDDATVLEQTGWRNKILDYFSVYSSVKIINPTRRPHGSDLTDKEVFNLDIKDLNESSLAIMDCRLHENKKQFGSPAEAMYFSYVLKRPILGWYNKDEGYNEGSIFQNVLVDRFFGDLDELLDHITTYYI